MSTYRPLALKYRPTRLAQVLGQERVTATLRGAFKAGKIPNLIILYGPTGTGKTTLARILGRYVNCSSDGGADTCEGCPSCDSFKKDRHPDIHEVDGGTFTGIDNVRQMQQVIGFHPRYKRKIYILDECHSLSKQAWTASLKMFEEPPPKVTFVLCTTDLQKVPDNIQGRGVLLGLNTIPESLVTKWIKKLAAKEGCENFPDDAASMIARVTQGHPRNILNTLERVLLAMEGGDKKLDIQKEIEEIVTTTLGLPPETMVAKYVQSLLTGHAHNALRILNDVQSAQYFMGLTFTLLRQHIYKVVAPKLVDPKYGVFLAANEGALRQWKPAKLASLMDIFIKGYERLKGYVVPERETLEWVTLQALSLQGFHRDE